MVSWEGSAPEAQGEIWSCGLSRRRDFSHQERLEKGGTGSSSPSSQWLAAQVSRLARCSTWMVLVVTVRQMSL